MITDHVWRADTNLYARRAHPGQCVYMNCRRPVSEHERAGKGRRPVTNRRSERGCMTGGG